MLLSPPMPRRGEHLSPDVSNNIEEPKETVGRFIQLTRDPFPEVSRSGDIFWESVTGRLYGDEELLRVTKDERYKGIKGIESDLEAALKRGGLSALKAEFFAKALEHTELGTLRGAVVLILEKIIAFK